MRKVILTLAWLIAAVTVTAQPERLLTNSRHISIADGLPCNQIFDMAQDADGYIWMAAANGLCRYDGYHFLNFYTLGPEPDPLKGVVGYVIADDDKRHLWLQTSTYVFVCYDLLTGSFIDYTGRGDHLRTYRKYIQGRQGILWMFDDESGVRRVKAGNDGRIMTTDYTKENGTLPHNRVNDAIEDDKGRLWVMTLNGLVVIDAQGKPRTLAQGINYRKGIIIGHQALTLTEKDGIMTYDTNGRLLRKTPIAASTGEIPVVTASFEWQGQWIIMTRGNTFTVSPLTSQLSSLTYLNIPYGTIMQSFDGNHFVSNSSGTLWVFPANGDMRRLDLMGGIQVTTERFRRYNITRDSDDLYYIASHGNGLFVYDLKADRLQHYSATEPWPVVGNNYLNNILIDRSGCIWLSEESTGITCILPPDEQHADYYYPQPTRQGDWSNNIRMVSCTEGHVVLSTKDNQLYELDPTTDQFKNLIPEQSSSRGERLKLRTTVYCYMKDSQGHTWMGTRGSGLYIDGRHADFPANHIYDILEDRQGRLWIATWGEGLFVVKRGTDGSLNYTQLMKRSYNESHIRIIRPDDQQGLWIASNNGVYHIDMRKKSLTDDDLTAYNSQNSDLPFDEIICLATTKDYVWIGSRGGGLLKCQYEKDGKRFKVTQDYSTHDGLMTNNVYAITADQQGNVWVGTDNGLTRIGHDQKVSAFQFGHTLQSNIYSENCTAIMPDGRLLMGTAYGLMMLKPEVMAKTHADKANQPVVTMVSINGNDRYLYSLNSLDSLNTLAYNQNSLVLAFSNLDYAGINSTQYRYYMEGVERDWLPLTSVNEAHYNGLQPGRYRFHLMALSRNNEWSEEYVLPIVICEPWYNTWWAWLLYLTAVGIIAFYVYRSWKRNFQLHQQIRMEKELTTFRLNFFTHIAHEFRTPLAIISGAADKLTQKGNEAQVSKSALYTVRRGTQRLNKLVNQLMEFRRINTGNQRLAVAQADIVRLIRNTTDEFHDLAVKKEQTLTFTPFARQYEVAIDTQLVETMLYNLLSNAVKYTPVGGTVSVRIRLEEPWLVITVEDNGPGISPQQVPQLYQPFMHGYVSQGGMGIGLYTAYKTARLHKGGLAYERVSLEGGSRFILTLPATDEVYSSTDYAQAAAVSPPNIPEQSSLRGEDLLPEACNDYTIVIIEDDPDMMDQIRHSIAPFFKTVAYTVGQSALNGIEAQRPDLILCDVMLPDINGYDIVKKIRGSETLRGIPVIMLTALDGDDHLLRGYKAGADDYMVKPCNFELLILRITQLIKWYQGSSPIPADTPAHSLSRSLPLNIITDEADKRFREKVEIIVARHLSEPDFNVDTLAALLKMGRTKFYGKMKEFTGMSPNTYLQTARLERAAELLIEGELNVTEISYKVGFQTPTYFYKCFKEKYGIPPSKYGKKS